jgi:hypothetical protein
LEKAIFSAVFDRNARRVWVSQTGSYSQENGAGDVSAKEMEKTAAPILRQLFLGFAVRIVAADL